MSAYSELQSAAAKVVGTRRTIDAVRRGTVEKVFIAKDASEHLVAELHELCSTAGIQVVYVESMAELGLACGINMRAASAAIIA